jgi:acetyl-CoA acetyltransferase
MQQFGVTQDHLGAVAVSQRAWAVDNPAAQLRDPLTLEEYHRSRWIVEPLHLLDCCLVSNGGAAVVVTTPERAAHLAQPPVRVLGWGQAHPGYVLERGTDFGLVTGAAASGPAALKMAGMTPADVDVREIYDCYTYTVLVTLEDYGFCAKGEAGELAAGGALAPGGSMPTNTGGGQLSSYYLWGMTPLIEAVAQVRGQAGPRQVPHHDVAMVSGNGGVLDHHASLVLGAAA